MTWKAEELTDLKGFTVEWAEPGNYILSRRNQIFRTYSLDQKLARLASVDAPLWKQAASKSRLAQRLLRFMVTNVIRLPGDELFVTFDKSVGVITGNEYHELKGLVRPCRVLRSACAVDKGGNIYFGEYLANNERGEMRVYKFAPSNDEIEIVYTFEPKSIRHIHGLYYDDFTDSIVCLTGDAEKECRMLRTRDGFSTVEVIGEGDETWRAVSILFSKNNLYYGTDAEFRANQLFRLDRETLKRSSLCDVTGTVFYSKRIDTDLFFTTTAENAPSQDENVAAIWRVSENDGCEQLIKFRKDLWPGTLFMFGTIHFPFVNRVNDKLFFSVVGVKEDNRTFCLSRK